MRWICSNMVCIVATSAVALGQGNISRETLPPAASSTYDQSTGTPSGDRPDARAAERADVLPDAPSAEDPRKDNKLLHLPNQLLNDEIRMWTSPRRARLSDATWLVPLGGFAAALFATDTDISHHLSNSAGTLLEYKHISDYGAYSMGGGVAGLYLLGLATHNEHERESGLLSGEAAIDALAAVEALKYASGRERPYLDNANGKFFRGGSSFPSEHSAGAWAIAGIMAHEYPSPFMKFFSYGLAGLVSATRVNAKEHFPSDVLVGAAIGYLTSAYVYHNHHNPDLAGSSWELPAIRPDRPAHWQAKDMGSAYVPLDSWIYPALERLAALGFIDSAIMGMRPWTRMECARQVSEAQDRIVEDEPDQGEAAPLYHDLSQEFTHEIELLSGGDNAELRVESTYTRATEIAGKPLTDGYHFAQTIYDDFGRPEEQGFNNVSGLSGWAESGPFVAYVRGEYQHSPSAPPLPFAARQAESTDDFAHSIIPPPYPIPPDTVNPAVSRGRLLDSYVAINVSDWQFSYGKQSLWWGPSKGGGMMMSDNADPLTMFRIDRVKPLKLPSIFGLLGPMKVEFFLGQYSGYEFMFTPTGLVGQYGQSLHPQPIIHGERFSFKPTPNFEFGLSRTTDYGGPGYPLTMHTFLRSVFSTTLTIPGAPNKPGSRRSGLDFSYRIPRWGGLTFYADGFTEHDTFSPIAGPDVAAWLGGIYLPRLPKIQKMDLRVEGVETDPPIGGNVGYGFFYYDPTWITGFQNSGHLMGNWVGRQGVGVQAWTTYWLTPRNKLQFGFRHQKVDNQFLPNGGTLADASVRGELWERTSFNVSALVQYEAWNFPVISGVRQSNVATSLQFTFWPKGFFRKNGSDH
jgi:membrane-associated phospholipid phosphatase